MNTIKSISPIDGSVYFERPIANDEEISTAVSAAHDSQINWLQLSISERGTYCHAAVDAMLTHAEDIAIELAWQMGRPVRYGAGELAGFAERARHMIDIASDTLSDVEIEQKPGFNRFIRHEPLGVVLTIAPWNFPFLTTVNSVIPALMAGNCVILKHAANTLKVAERFSQAFAEANLPDAVFQHLVLGHQQTTELIASGQVDMVCFTGSVAAGRTIEKAAAGQFIPVGLELGGKDPAYVRDDCNVQHAIEIWQMGLFLTQANPAVALNEFTYMQAFMMNFWMVL